MAYFDYDDRYGCRVSAGTVTKEGREKGLQKAVESAKAKLDDLRYAVDMLVSHNWADAECVSVGDYCRSKYHDSKPFYEPHGMTKDNFQVFLEKAEKEYEFFCEKLAKLNGDVK